MNGPAPGLWRSGEENGLPMCNRKKILQNTPFAASVLKPSTYADLGKDALRITATITPLTAQPVVNAMACHWASIQVA